MKKMEAKIRKATVEDVSELAKTYIAAFKPVDPSENWTEERAAALISFFIERQSDLAFVAELNSRIVGAIFGLAKPWWDGVHLVETELFVAPEAQRKGVGAALFRHYLHNAKNLYSAKIMESITFKELAFPSSWYAELGFREKEEWKVLLGEVEALFKKLGEH